MPPAPAVPTKPKDEPPAAASRPSCELPTEGSHGAAAPGSRRAAAIAQVFRHRNLDIVRSYITPPITSSDAPALSTRGRRP
jgi:hypothetical protein